MNAAMPVTFSWWWILGFGICLAVLAGMVAWLAWQLREVRLGRRAAALAAAQLLRNPGMEGPYLEHDGTTIVADSWMPFYGSGKSPLRDEPCRKPEFKPIPRTLAAYRVIEGEMSQCWFIRWWLMDAGVYQRVAVPVGARLTFSAWVHTWCSDSNDPRTDDGEFYFQLGMDRQGGLDAWGPGVDWSEWTRATKQYQRLELQGIAATAEVTVFVRAANKWPMAHNDAYLDDVRLEAENGSPGQGITRAELAAAYREFAERLVAGK